MHPCGRTLTQVGGRPWRRSWGSNQRLASYDLVKDRDLAQVALVEDHVDFVAVDQPEAHCSNSSPLPVQDFAGSLECIPYRSGLGIGK